MTIKRGGLTPTAEKAEAADMLRRLIETGSVARVHELYYSHYSYAKVWRRIDKALKRERSLQADRWRKLQDRQLDALTERTLEHVLDVNPQVSLAGIAAMLRIMERRAKLHGLDAETKVQVTGEVVKVSDETLTAIEQAQARLKALTEKEGPKPLRAVE